MSKGVVQPSINLKLSEELKRRIKEKSDFEGLTVSKYIRELLSNYLDGTLCVEEKEVVKEDTFFTSIDFLQLIVWMYSKRNKNSFQETEEDLDRYIRILKKIEMHLPKNLSIEFDKVLLDILRVKNEKSKYSKNYEFARSYSSSPEFNFMLLEAYLLTIK
ncbi:ribbon-helix-helix protein, CopG family [Lacinutrix undariae]